jgi:alpha-N-arabinofuranosidase
MDGNVFFRGTHPCKQEKNPLLLSMNPAVKLVEKPDGIYLRLTLPPNWAGNRTRKLVTTELLGAAAIPNLPFENPDGTPLRIDSDYLGSKRNGANPTPGPFEDPGTGTIWLKLTESKGHQAGQ